MVLSFLRAKSQQATLRKDRHPLSSPRFNPSFHTPGFSNLPALQFRLSSARKARLAAVLENSQAEPDTSKVAGTFGSTKIRTTENRYTWRKTTAVGPVQDPGPIFNDAAAGSLRIHEYKGGLQVWVLDTVKAGTTIKYHWTVPTQGSAHPTLPAYFLHIKDQKMPSWVLRSTINTYASRQKRASANSPAPTEDSLGGGGQRVTRFRLNAAAGGL